MNELNMANAVFGTTLAGAVFLNLLWKLLCYEFRIHFGNDYLVKIKYKIADTRIVSASKYAVKAFSENGAYIRAMNQYMHVRKIDDVLCAEVIKVG